MSWPSALVQSGGSPSDLRRGVGRLLFGSLERFGHLDLPGLALLRHSSPSSSGSPLVHAGGPAHRRPVSGGREQLLQFPRQASSTGRGHVVGVLVHLVSCRSEQQNQQNQRPFMSSASIAASVTFDPHPPAVGRLEAAVRLRLSTLLVEGGEADLAAPHQHASGGRCRRRRGCVSAPQRRFTGDGAAAAAVGPARPARFHLCRKEGG